MILVKVDFCVDLKGALSDSCWSYIVGETTPELDRLYEVTKNALYLGIQQAEVGNRIGDIGHAIQTYVEKKGSQLFVNLSDTELDQRFMKVQPFLTMVSLEKVFA